MLTFSDLLNQKYVTLSFENKKFYLCLFWNNAFFFFFNSKSSSKMSGVICFYKMNLKYGKKNRKNRHEFENNK